MDSTPNLVAYVAKLIIKSENEILAECWQNAIKTFFEDIGDQCKEAGVLAIGHIKGFLSFSIGKGFCYFSYVDNKQGTNCQGEIDHNLTEGTLDFNVLVYEEVKHDINNIVKHCIQLLETNLKCKCILNKSK